MSAKQAAEKLGVTVKMLWGHVHDGEIAVIVTGRGKKRPMRAFDPDDLDVFLESRRSGPQPVSAPVSEPEPPIDFRKYRRKHAQKVYFIRAGDTVKIGIAVNPKTRLGTLQVARAERLDLLLVLPGGAARERKLHARFAADVLQGEWFTLSPAIRRFIDRHKAAGR